MQCALVKWGFLPVQIRYPCKTRLTEHTCKCCGFTSPLSDARGMGDIGGDTRQSVSVFYNWKWLLLQNALNRRTFMRYTIGLLRCLKNYCQIKTIFGVLRVKTVGIAASKTCPSIKSCGSGPYHQKPVAKITKILLSYLGLLIQR